MNRPFNDQRFYDQVSSELRNKEIHDGLWVKALGRAQGDKTRAEGIYIELRVDFLIDEAQDEIDEEINYENRRKTHAEKLDRKEKLIEKVAVYQNHEDTNYPFSWFVFITFLIFPIVTIIYLFANKALKWGCIATGLAILLGFFVTIIEMSATLALWPWIVVIAAWLYVSIWLGEKARYVIAESKEPLKGIIKSIDQLENIERENIFSEFDKRSIKGDAFKDYDDYTINDVDIPLDNTGIQQNPNKYYKTSPIYDYNDVIIIIVISLVSLVLFGAMFTAYGDKEIETAGLLLLVFLFSLYSLYRFIQTRK